MKTNIKYILSTFAAAGLMLACSPEEFDGADINGIPVLNIEPVITVEQDINQVTFSLPQGTKDVMPVWILVENKGTDKEKTIYSTVDGFKKIFVYSGDYEVGFKLMNRNGQSDATQTYTFHIDNSLVDFASYFARVSKSPWHIANKTKGHMACGSSSANPTEWWSAGEDEKKDFGVYDNVLTFTDNGNYTFDPGEHGTIYVNWGVTENDWQKTYWSGTENDDFNVPVQKQETSYDFISKGNDVYLTFPQGTYFPYIAYNEIWEQPEYKVVNLTTKEMTLIAEKEGAIAWQFILTTEDTVERVFTGFTYDQPDNIWKNIEVKAGGIYYADTGWSPYPDNGGSTFEVTNKETKVVLPMATASQWQAQFPIHTNIGPGSPMMTSAKHYDFSCVINSNKDLNGMTLKLVETGDNGVPGSLGINYDANAVFYDNSTNLKAFEDYVFYLVDQPGVDVQDNLLQLVLDFGGCAEGTEVTISNIVLIEHDLNKELDKLPGNQPVPGGDSTMDWDVTSSANLWNAVETGDAFLSVTPWFANDGWSQIGDPEWSHENGVWSITMPDGIGHLQWQGQFPINTTLTASASKKYNFYCVVEADNDCPGVTIKFTQTDNEEKHDDNYFFADRHKVTAFEPFIYKAKGVTLPKNDAHAMSLFFDFGETPAGTNVKISKIYFEEDVTLDYNDENNLWKAVDAGDAFISVTPWFANNDWAQIADPEWSHSGNAWELTLPEGIGGAQWQGQFPINTTLTASMADSYNFSCTVEASNDCPNVTIKFTESDDENKHDDNFFFADRHNITAYEPFVYTMKGVKLPKNDAHAMSLFFDFGGSPAGTQIKISNIIFTKQ